MASPVPEVLTREDLLEQALEMPALEARKRLFRAHIPLLDDECADALKAQADVYLRSDIQLCRETAELLLYQAELNGNPLHRALGLLAEANARSLGLSEYERAIELYDEAAHLYEVQGCLVEQARSQIGKIGALGYLGRYQEALDTGAWASRVLEEHGLWQVLAGLVINMAIIHGRAGDDALALKMLDRAQELYAQMGMEGEPAWLWVQMNRGTALRNLGRFEESLRASRNAWEGQNRLGQPMAAARAQQSMALTHFVLGRYNEALAHLNEVRDAFLADGRQRDAMLVELFTSDCLLQLRRFGDVLDKCRRVRDLFAKLGTDQVVAQAIVNEAVAYAQLDRFPEALASLAEARHTFESEGNRVWIAATDLEKAIILLRQGHGHESLTLARECATLFQDCELPVEAAQSSLAAGRAALALDQVSLARDLALQTLEIGKERDVPMLVYQAHALLGAVALARGEPGEALDAFDLAIHEVERLRGWLMVEYRSGFVEDKEEIYQDAVRVCLDLDQAARGLEYAERAKSRALLDLLAYRVDLGIRVRSEADRPLVEKLLDLRSRRDYLYRRWESQHDGQQRGRTLMEGEQSGARQEVLDLEDQITKLWHQLLIRNADYAQEASLHTVRTEPAQPYLSPDTLLIEYFVVRGQLVAFLVTAEGVQSRQLDCPLSAIHSLLRLLWLNLRSVPRSSPDRLDALTANARGLLQQLHECLFAPLADDLDPYRRLTLVPHGPLHYLPFHALHDGERYLLQRWEIHYLPGSSFMRYAAKAPKTGAGLLAVGHSDDGRLPHAVQEAGSVAELFDGHTLLEQKATLDELQRRAPNCRILHLAAHGDFRPDNPLFSGLTLSEGWLTTLDIFTLQLNASLVTLSACQTGRNVVAGGDELLGLMRAFLCAGAASLVLSLWAVEDRSTEIFMTEFYRQLAAGEAKGVALRRAQAAFIRGQGAPPDGAYSHPYFWAPFFLVGNAGPL
jgi:CHAT domain-containing protein